MSRRSGDCRSEERQVKRIRAVQTFNPRRTRSKDKDVKTNRTSGSVLRK